jgi:flagellar biosynthesis protein
MEKGIALKYDGEIPRVLSVAKGNLLAKMLEIAEKNAIPVYKDRNLAELLSRLPVGSSIPEDLFKAVAEIFAFCYGNNESFRNQIDFLKG